MIARIVKMTFNEGFEEKFLDIFNNSCDEIRASEGCEGLILYRDEHNTSIFFTYSFWNSHDALNNYRESMLFKTTWAATKVLFADKPEAYSLSAVKAML
jgi:heme-degrading monooxygenase HmoA